MATRSDHDIQYRQTIAAKPRCSACLRRDAVERITLTNGHASWRCQACIDKKKQMAADLKAARADLARRRAQTKSAGARCANHPERPAAGWMNNRSRCAECIAAAVERARAP